MLKSEKTPWNLEGLAATHMSNKNTHGMRQGSEIHTHIHIYDNKFGYVYQDKITNASKIIC